MTGCRQIGGQAVGEWWGINRLLLVVTPTFLILLLGTMQYNTMQYDTMQYNTIKCYEWPVYYTGTWGRLFTGTESDPLDENLNFNSAIQLLAGLKVQILTWNFAPIYLLEIVIAPPSESNKRVTYIGYQRKNYLFTAKGDFFLLKNHL